MELWKVAVIELSKLFNKAESEDTSKTFRQSNSHSQRSKNGFNSQHR